MVASSPPSLTYSTPTAIPTSHHHLLLPLLPPVLVLLVVGGGRRRRRKGKSLSIRMGTITTTGIIKEVVVVTTTTTSHPTLSLPYPPSSLPLMTPSSSRENKGHSYYNKKLLYLNPRGVSKK